MNKQEYLDMHSKIYDKRCEYSKNIFHTIPYVTLSIKDEEKKWNVQYLIMEINLLICEINLSIECAMAYNYVIKHDKFKGGEIHRNIYIKNVLNRICSFKDKIVFLFREILGMKIYNNDKREISDNRLDIKKINNYLNKIEYENINKECNLNKEAFVKVKEYIKNLSEIESIIFEFRNANTHRYDIGIESFGSGVWKKEHIKGFTSLSLNISNNIKFTKSNVDEKDGLIQEIEEVIHKYNIYNKEIFEELIKLEQLNELR